MTETDPALSQPPVNSLNHLKKKRRDWHDITSLVFLGVTLLSAMAAAVFTGRQAYLANKQLRVARDTFAVARDQEQRQLRAYVGILIRDLGTTNPFAPPRIPTVSFDYKNSGSTPAYHVTHESGASLCDHPLPIDFPFSVIHETLAKQPDRPITIFPGTITNLGITTSTSGPLTPAMFAAIADGQTIRVCFWGTILYDDAFGYPRYTNYCYSYFGTVETITHETCEQHNDAN
jgi:hypothetical protein